MERSAIACLAALALWAGCEPVRRSEPPVTAGGSSAVAVTTAAATAGDPATSGATSTHAPPGMGALGADCRTDADCSSEARTCVRNGPATRCSRACGPGAPCPSGWHCLNAFKAGDEHADRVRACWKVERPVVIEPPNDPTKRPPDNVAGCDADPSHCCAEGGVIRYAGCCGGALPPTCAGSGPDRGPGGVCEGCTRRCLPPWARIATPSGARPVAELQLGDVVWTADALGARVSAPLLAVTSRSVEGPHELVIVTLEDGREVAASPGHPTAHGDALGALAVGDVLDGAAVIAVRRESFSGAATWDLLPAGATGAYWADGVLLGSTLVPGR